MKTILSFLVLLLWATPATAKSLINGLWTGIATRGGETTSISIHVEPSRDGPKAHYAIPSLGVEGIPLTRFGFDPASNEIKTSRAFQGKLENGRITGQLYPVLLHGGPVEVNLTRSGAPPVLTARKRPVEFTSRGNVLKGWLVSPLKPGRYPAMVSLHGSGPSTRWLALARARRLAEAGYAMLIFDKPGSGESKGDWTMSSLNDMAEDAIQAMEFLRVQPEVDPRKVGLWGHSQAGWIISRAGAMTDNIAFAIILAGGGSTSRDIEDYGYLGRLRRAGASKAAVDKAMAWVRSYYDYVSTGQGYDALVGRLKAEEGEEWAKSLGISTVYPTPEQQPKWQWVAAYDPASDIRRMKMPILLLFPQKDENGPSEKSLALWRQALRASGNRNVEWKLFADAEHHFLVPAHADGWPSLAPNYYETQIDWLNRVVR